MTDPTSIAYIYVHLHICFTAVFLFYLDLTTIEVVSSTHISPQFRETSESSPSRLATKQTWLILLSLIFVNIKTHPKM